MQIGRATRFALRHGAGKAAAESHHHPTTRDAGVQATGERRIDIRCSASGKTARGLLERELTPQQFAAWIKPLKAIQLRRRNR